MDIRKLNTKYQEQAATKWLEAEKRKKKSKKPPKKDVERFSCLTQSFTIDGQMANLNDIIGENRRNRYAGSGLKKREQRRVVLACRGLKPMSPPVHISVKFHEPDRKRDPDNVFSAVKFILDGLVEAGVLGNDGQLWLPPPSPIDYSYDIDRNNPRVEVCVSNINPL